jgi:hypothetical protein
MQVFACTDEAQFGFMIGDWSMWETFLEVGIVLFMVVVILEAWDRI